MAGAITRDFRLKLPSVQSIVCSIIGVDGLWFGIVAWTGGAAIFAPMAERGRSRLLAHAYGSSWRRITRKWRHGPRGRDAYLAQHLAVPFRWLGRSAAFAVCHDIAIGGTQQLLRAADIGSDVGSRGHGDGNNAQLSYLRSEHRRNGW